MQSFDWVIHVYKRSPGGYHRDGERPRWGWYAVSYPLCTLEEAAQWIAKRRGGYWHDDNGVAQKFDDYDWRIFNYKTGEVIPGAILV